MHEVLVNRLGGLSLPKKSVVRLTDHRDMTDNIFGNIVILYEVTFLQHYGFADLKPLVNTFNNNAFFASIK